MKIRNIVGSVVVLAIAGLVAVPVSAQEGGTLPNYLFSQYYTQPGASMVNAEMYPAPLPVPAHVGHTYYTYQPLMPHEMMYQHARNYYNYHAGSDAFYTNGDCRWPYGGALTKTRVRWQAGGTYYNMTGNCRPFAALNYKLSKHWYSARQPGAGLRGWGLGHGKCHGGCLAGQCPTGECETVGGESTTEY